MARTRKPPAATSSARAGGRPPRQRPAAKPPAKAGPFGLKRWQLILALVVVAIVLYLIWRSNKSSSTAADTTTQPATTDQTPTFDGSGATSGQPQQNTPPQEITNNYYGTQANPTSAASQAATQTSAASGSASAPARATTNLLTKGGVPHMTLPVVGPEGHRADARARIRLQKATNKLVAKGKTPATPRVGRVAV